MRLHKHLLVGGAVIIAMAAMAAASFGATHTGNGPVGRAHHVRRTDDVRLGLTPSSPQLAACMPGAQLDAEVALTADEHGFDRFAITAHHLPPNRDFTIFLLEQAGAPFGAAQYIGDFSTDAGGNAHNNLKLIVQEAFASTLVNGSRVRVDLNRVGVWFADPLGDDFCLGDQSPRTPFDGDNAAGVQAFNSANAEPLPAP
ncbi:MAG: hypothetical protein ACXVRZ_08090 [Gaiellaceae bacterium]